MPPAVIFTCAPIASRLLLVPANPKLTQCRPETPAFLKIIGDPVKSSNTTSIFPSLNKSPTASPRETRGSRNAGPACSLASQNVPFPKFMLSTFGSLYRAPEGSVSTCGYTCPFTPIKSSQPSLSKSTNAIPHLTYASDAIAVPLLYATSLKFHFPSFLNKFAFSSEKLVTASDGNPLCK